MRNSSCLLALTGSAKNRATSGSPGRATKGSKAKLAQEVEAQQEVDDEGANEAEEEYVFLGYDVGDDLLHVTGVQSSMFPHDGGEIRVEKTEYVRGARSVSAAVYKDGNILKLHFLEPLDEILPEQASKSEDASSTAVISKLTSTTQTAGSLERTEDDSRADEPSASDEGVEKSEFEASEKTTSFQQATMETEETSPELAPANVFCAHASFVAQLNDGMVITSSGFGAQGKPGRKDGKKKDDKG